MHISKQAAGHQVFSRLLLYAFFASYRDVPLKRRTVTECPGNVYATRFPPCPVVTLGTTASGDSSVFLLSGAPCSVSAV